MPNAGHQVLVRHVASGPKGDTFILTCVCGQWERYLANTTEERAYKVAQAHEES